MTGRVYPVLDGEWWIGYVQDGTWRDGRPKMAQPVYSIESDQREECITAVRAELARRGFPGAPVVVE